MTTKTHRIALWLPALIGAIFTTAMQAEDAGSQIKAAIQPGDTLYQQNRQPRHQLGGIAGGEHH
jgi:hypothetical protein